LKRQVNNYDASAVKEIRPVRTGTGGHHHIRNQKFLIDWLIGDKMKKQVNNYDASPVKEIRHQTSANQKSPYTLI
jgi:hypothetical protein